MGDPNQLLRIVGASVKLYPDAEQFYHHENVNNLTIWQGDGYTRIDRFDGRALLDNVPSRSHPVISEAWQDREIADELNFERYRDLVEVDRLEVTERERLEEIEQEWTNILARHKALLAMLNPKYVG
ncbi:alternative splicing regulator-domain-containing protein [Umbelopsis sp. PMI_123]|nr:alternative splicing regulator-domain-containing protein [Umbelopsis sp. PMI_123]